MTALYKLPGKTAQTLKLSVQDGPSLSSMSILPAIISTFLDRLSNPAPTHHLLRAPFIRPLINKNASRQPVFNLLSPAIAARPEDLEANSPLQARLIDFFEENKHSLLRNTRIEQGLHGSVYCMHEKDLIGPPKLLINDIYNNTLNIASKQAALVHAITVLSHQFSLMLQSMVSSHFMDSVD